MRLLRARPLEDGPNGACHQGKTDAGIKGKPKSVPHANDFPFRAAFAEFFDIGNELWVTANGFEDPADEFLIRHTLVVFNV